MLISASRRTDIPNYFFPNFLKKLHSGSIEIVNPYNRAQVRTVSLLPEDVDCIIFWTKNPTPAISSIDSLKDYLYLFLFTLNGYPEYLEPNLPELSHRIASFKKLSDAIGSKRVIWRYDPIIFSEKLDFLYHIERFSYIARQLSGYTQQVIISFVDFYKKCLKKIAPFEIFDPEFEIKCALSRELNLIASTFGITLSLCCERDVAKAAELPNSACIDPLLIGSLTGKSYRRSYSQRSECLCAQSVDVGTYATCRNGCIYCYAAK